MSVMVSGLHRMVGADGPDIVDIARLADELGIDELVVGDHVVMGERLDRYPYGDFAYAADLPAIAPDEPWPDVLVVLAAIAGATQRIRLAPGVLLVPLRHPVVLAKSLATIDDLSDGRLSVGVGVGWQREEYDALGVPWAQRWTRLCDGMRACRVLWASGPSSFTSSSVSFSEIHCTPRPAQPRLPVWLGAQLDDERAQWLAEWGDGWFPLDNRPDAVRIGVARLRQTFAAAGRDVSEIGVRVGVGAVTDDDGTVDVTATLSAAAPAIEAGATVLWFVISPALRLARVGPLTRHLEGLAAVADALRPVRAPPRP
jgi:probable F420-dependent oxidoreductase